MSFTITYSHFKCAHLFVNIFIIFFGTPCTVSPRADCESKQHSSSPSWRKFTKLQFIRIKIKLVYIGRRRTMSLMRKNTRVNKNCNNTRNLNTKGCQFLAHHVHSCCISSSYFLNSLSLRASDICCRCSSCSLNEVAQLSFLLLTSTSCTHSFYLLCASTFSKLIVSRHTFYPAQLQQ